MFLIFLNYLVKFYRVFLILRYIPALLLLPIIQNSQHFQEKRLKLSTQSQKRFLMRFSSDEEFFDQNSKVQQKNDGTQTPKKKEKEREKKQTLLSKFLDSIDENVMQKLLNYQKLKRPIFQRRAIVPPKISLYEDVLFITIFKENQQKISKDSKQIKSVCLDLESRTKRKQCTIRERIQKKLCKMSSSELLDHVGSDKDIAFNLKKILTSSSTKGEASKKQKQNEQQNVKKQEESGKNTPQSAEKSNGTLSAQKNYEVNDQPIKSNQIKHTQIAKPQQEFFQQEQSQKIQAQICSQSLENKQQEPQEDLDEKEIFIVFKKTENQSQNMFMINRLLIHQQIIEIKRREKQNKERQILMSQLKAQIGIINIFKAKSQYVPPQIQTLIMEAEKITKLLGLTQQIPQLNQNQEKFCKIAQLQVQKIPSQMVQQTTDRNNNQLNEKVNDTNLNINTSQFSLSKQNEAEQSLGIIQVQEKPEIQSQYSHQCSKYTIEYSLCQNQEYLKLYKSDPSTFEPLLWTQEQDSLIDKLLLSTSTGNESEIKNLSPLFHLLIRYKGPQMFIERCIFLNKNLLVPESQKLMEMIKSYQPLNISKLYKFFQNESKTSNNVENMSNLEKIREQQGIIGC